MPVVETEKQVIIKHVPSQERINEIVQEEIKKDKNNVVKCPTVRSNLLELKDKMIYFVVWYELKKVWNHVNGFYGYGNIDFREIDKEFEMMKNMAHIRKEMHVKRYKEKNNAKT